MSDVKPEVQEKNQFKRLLNSFEKQFPNGYVPITVMIEQIAEQCCYLRECDDKAERKLIDTAFDLYQAITLIPEEDKRLEEMTKLCAQIMYVRSSVLDRKSEVYDSVRAEAAMVCYDVPIH